MLGNHKCPTVAQSQHLHPDSHPYQMLVTASRQIARHSSMQNMFIQIWRKIKSFNKWRDRGVVAGISRQVKKLKWTRDEPLNITPKEHKQLSLVCPLNKWFKHQAREALMQTELIRPYERKDMAGIENAVEYEHTVALLRSGKLLEGDQGWLG